jgi:virginiamycin B lyase
MRALTAGVLGLLVISRALAATADAVVHLFPATHSGGAVQMSGNGDGEIWIAQPNDDSLVRVNPDGSTSEQPLAAGSRPLAIARDVTPGGTVFFTETGTNRIGSMDTEGVVTEYDIPTPASNPRGIALSGDVWFTEYDGNRIGRLNVGSATPIVEYPLPTFNAGPLGIAPGPGVPIGSTDIWFTEYLANKIGRIDANGVITEYDIPTPDSGPTSIVEGVSDNVRYMYFTESKASKIGRITSAGQITEFPIPTLNSGPEDIAADRFGGVWFSERLAAKLAWFSEGIGFREFLLPGGSRPEGISLTYGDDLFVPRAVWYIDGTRRRVGRLSDNRLFAVGAGHGAGWDTDFEFSNPNGPTRPVRLGYEITGVCPTICPSMVAVEVPGGRSATASASDVPFSDGDHLYVVDAFRPEINHVPPTRAWIVDGDDLRLELPLIDYWTVVSREPALPPGTIAAQPNLKFPARRRAGVRTDLELAGIERGEDGLDLLLEAETPDGEVIGELPLRLAVGELTVLDSVLSDLRVFEDFDGYLRVTRVSRSGLFWGVVKIYESEALTHVLAPGSELEEPPCVGGPALCGAPRRPRIVTRQVP